MVKEILVIGSGVREACIINKLVEDALKSNNNVNIINYGVNINPTIKLFTNDIYVDKNYSLDKLDTIISSYNINFAIIGPELPLANGIVNHLELVCKIPCIGPYKQLAKIETSKSFARNLINECNLSDYSPKNMTIRGISNQNADEKKKSINETINKFTQFNNTEIVVKADGLSGGKGVRVEGKDFIDRHSIMNELLNLKSDETYVIEEKLEGEEFSLISFTDGLGNIIDAPPVQDYKRLGNGDVGPNTGSMGCIINSNCSLPFLNDDDLNIASNINSLIIYKLNELALEKYKLNHGYRGIIYGSFMKTKTGEIKIIEFNCRFGDPEVAIILQLMKSNFYKLCCSMVSKNGLLNFEEIQYDKKAIIGVYLVPNSYPLKSKEKYDIYINDFNDVFTDDCISNNINKLNYVNEIDARLGIEKNYQIFFGSVEHTNGHIYSLSSRSLLYLQIGNSINECYKKIYSINGVKRITGNLKYRNDIGAKYLNSYQRAGVSICDGEMAVKQMKKYVMSTYTPSVLNEYGSFGGEFRLLKDRGHTDTLVASIDGVGTKTVLAVRKYGISAFENLGRDIVNHSVNDILVQGAIPLFFLDYYGCNHLNLKEITTFIKGVSEACIESGNVVLLGGETAEMPIVYNIDHTDLVGCIIGCKDNRFFNGTKEIVKGDILIGIPSVGPHTNGFSLINSLSDKIQIPDSIVKTLLTPHKCYLNDIINFGEKYEFVNIKGMAHITGGGLIENCKRVLPKNNDSNLDIKLNPKLNDKLPEWCKFIKEDANLSNDELWRIYNCGIGFVLILDADFYNNICFELEDKFIYVGEII